MSEKKLAAIILAVGISLALLWHPISHFFRPYLLPALFCVVTFSLLPTAQKLSVSFFLIRKESLKLVVWQQLVLPAVILVLGPAIGLNKDLVFYALITVTAGSLFASPALAQMLDLNRHQAIQSVILSTLLMPISIFIFFGVYHGEFVDLDLKIFAMNVGMFIVLPIAIMFAYKVLTSGLTEKANHNLDFLSRWASILSLLVFGFAIIDPAAKTLETDPERVFLYLLYSLGITTVILSFTFLIMIKSSRRFIVTSALLGGFRNIGLSYGLLSQMVHGDLAIYVGIAQVPVFLVPLLLFIFLPKNLFFTEYTPADSNDEPQMELNLEPKTAASGQTGPIGSSWADKNPMGSASTAKTIDIDRWELAHSVQTMSLSNSSNLAMELDPSIHHKIQHQTAEDRIPALLTRLKQHTQEAYAECQQIYLKQKIDRLILKNIGIVIACTVAGCVAIWQLNKLYAPMLFDDGLIDRVAEVHTQDQNFGVFDLNINIRDLRNATIAKMKQAPDAIVMGASHWQEAHVNLVTNKNFYNSHVHRDYYEDMLAVAQMYVQHNRLPKEVIIAIRDKLFTPVEDRTDFLWYPGIKYYRKMARKLGLEPHSQFETLEVQTWRELLSLPLLWENISREFMAKELPHATDKNKFDGLDVLLPGGSIIWSREHQATFTRARARKEALAFAEASKYDPPKIDPIGVESIDRLLNFLQSEGVKIVLAHPPFNPEFYDEVAGTPYMIGLEKIKELTKTYARKYNLPIIGSFDPREVGCDAKMYIDAEHSNATCLGKLLNQYNNLSTTKQQSNSVARLGG